MCSETLSKTILLVFNSIFLTLGLCTLGVGFYIRFVRTEFDAFIGSSLIPVATYVCIVAGGIVVFVSLVGCAGTLTQNRVLLSVYIGFLVLVFVLEVSVGIIGFLHHGKVAAMLEKTVKPAVLEKYGYTEHQLLTSAVDAMQQQLECCGYTEPADWTESKYYTDDDMAVMRGISIMPVSCCIDVRQVDCNMKHIDNLRFPNGCRDKVKELVEANLILLGAASIAIAVVQLLGVALAVSLCSKSGDDVNEF